MTHKHRIILYALFIGCMMSWFMLSRAKAQNVVRHGTVFVQQISSKDSVDTGYEYQDKDLVKHKVYLSPKGKAYIYVYSKKTGKGYRRYLPKVTKMLKDMDNERTNH